MKANIKCSSCGAEISNLNMSWGKQWLFSLLFIPLAFLPMLFLFRDSFFGKPDFRQELVVAVTQTHNTDDGLELTCTIENTGKHTWESMHVEVEFFDDDGDFIDEVGEFLTHQLPPGQKEHFRLTVHSARELLDLNTEIKVTDAMRDRF